MKKVKDRIKEIRKMAGRDLQPCPVNWRQHPQAQRDALRGVLAEVGVADVLKAWVRPDGAVELIDGHLRAEELQDHEWNVAILDVTEHEARYLLATHDPLGAMAETDRCIFSDLLNGVDSGNIAVQEMLQDILGDIIENEKKEDGNEETLFEQAVQLKPNREYAVIYCDSVEQWESLKNTLGLQIKRRGGYKKGKIRSETASVERVITAERFFNAISDSK